MSEHDEPKTALTRLLGAHLWHHTRTTHCSCGFRTPLAQLAIEGYLAHLADVLLAEGYTTSPAPEATETEWGVLLDDAGSTDMYDTREAAEGAMRVLGGLGLVEVTIRRVPVDRAADEHEEGGQ